MFAALAACNPASASSITTHYRHETIQKSGHDIITTKKKITTYLSQKPINWTKTEGN